ncbi:MAG: branched-chain amino acid ABC transporter permease [Pseudomonadota bacterium]
MNLIREIILTAFVGILLMFLLPLGVDVFTLCLLSIYALLGLSLGFIWGFGGILCFGQAAFFGLGAYAYAISAINIGTPWGPFFISIIVPALVAAVFGAMLFYGRLNDVYLAVLTLVFTLILYKFMNVTAGEEYVIGTARLGGYNGIPGFETLSLPWDPSEYLYGESLYYFCLVLLLACYLGLRWVLRSPFGRIVVAVRENELRAELMGYDVRLIKTAVFAIGGGVAGLAGCLYANWAEIVTPNLFSLGQSAEIIIWVIVGGAGTLAGPILGAAGLGYLKYLLGQQSLIDNTLVMGAVLVLAVLLLPRGIFPTIADLFQKRTGSRSSNRKRSSSRKRRARRRPIREGGRNGE